MEATKVYVEIETLTGYPHDSNWVATTDHATCSYGHAIVQPNLAPFDVLDFLAFEAGPAHGPDDLPAGARIIIYARHTRMISALRRAGFKLDIQPELD